MFASAKETQNSAFMHASPQRQNACPGHILSMLALGQEE